MLMVDITVDYIHLALESKRQPRYFTRDHPFDQALGPTVIKTDWDGASKAH
jgi:hypothetical protein